MALSMKDRNDKKAWSAYEKEGKKLMEEVMKRRKAIEEKHTSSETTLYGLDGAPDEKELAEVTRWYGEELIKLRQKYGIQ
ncbi:MAG: hypothetical protein LUG91_09840 [Ruminococcus sp.]|nr:hypothetical protein [Ruminococcus sp.]